MNSTQYTLIAIGLGLSAQMFSQQTPVMPARGEQRQVYVSELQRFNKLMSAKKYNEAESVLALIESYKGTPQQTKERAQVALWREDFGSAIKYLKLHFEGDEKTWASVGGAQDSKVWYWFLLTQNRDWKRAELMQESLFRDALSSPSIPEKPYRPELTSPLKVAQVYMYMANFSLRTRNYYRANRYIALAKTVDPKVMVDPGFAKLFKLHSERTWKSQEPFEKFPMVDHILFQKKLGRPLRAF